MSSPTRATSSPMPSRIRSRQIPRLVHLRHRCPSRRDGVVEGDHPIHRRSRRARAGDPFPGRAHQRPALRPQRRSWPALPERRRPHPAPGRTARNGHGRRRPSRRRAMESLAIDYMVVFPTPMLFLGMHPQPEMEVWLGRAYNRWLADRILAADDRIKSLIYLPFNTPEEAERTVAEFDQVPGVIGYCITSTRHKPVHHNHYMRLYAMIEERGKPLAFHAGYHWEDPSLATVNRFLGMHALGFVWSNM